MDNMIIFYLAKATMDSATTGNVVNWFNNNEGFVSMLLAFFSIIISVVTFIFSMNMVKKQNKIQQNIARQQDNLQKTQILVSLYPYKTNCRKSLNEIKVLSTTINSYLSKTPSENISVKSIIDKYNNSINCMNISLEETILTISDTLYFLTPETCYILRQILNDLNSLDSDIEYYKKYYNSTSSFWWPGSGLTIFFAEQIFEITKKLSEEVETAMYEILYDTPNL